MKRYKMTCGCGCTFSFTQNEIYNRNNQPSGEFVVCPDCETALDLEYWNYQEIEEVGAEQKIKEYQNFYTQGLQNAKWDIGKYIIDNYGQKADSLIIKEILAKCDLVSDSYIESLFADKPIDLVWTMGNGETINIEDMSTQHIVNCISSLEEGRIRNFDAPTCRYNDSWTQTWIQAFKKELKRRGEN